MYVDNDIIYLGGDFEFNGTYGAAIYNQTSKQLSSTPFLGFGPNSVVNAIAKVFEDDKDEVNQGSIIFGGKFNTLGLSNLLLHNTTSNSSKISLNETSNGSIITAEQLISLRHGIFTNVNGVPNQDESSIICPSNGNTFSIDPNQGGEWLVELPDEMKGITPTKARLYIPPGDNGIKLFRIYSYPNNGIMNLSYIDPSTNEITFCDAWCPLLTATDLENFANYNKQNLNTTNKTNSIFIDDNGSLSMYYDPSTKTKTLGYGAGFQEFAFVNDVGIDQIGVTIIDWYGSNGVLGGFELYQNAIYVYGNDTLNQPNCDKDESTRSLSIINSGNFESIQSLDSSVTITDYLVSQGIDSKITLYPNISYSGNYSIIMTTPGCTYDNSCSQRSIVNVSVIDFNDNILTTNLIFQNNNNNKFDYLFYGHLNGTSDSNGGQNRIEISFYNTIIPNTNNPWIVVDKIIADIVTLDKYYDMNLNNSSHKNSSLSYDLTQINLNGLFEYSLANFTNFDESLVSYIDKNNNQTIIPLTNTFVGNSSINILSSQLSENSIINQITLTNNTSNAVGNLILLGDFQSNSKNLTLTNSNIINLSLDNYNSTANESDINLINKKFIKRATDSQTIFGGEFNNSISSIINYNNGFILLGQFNIAGNNFRNLSNNNSSINSINNFALYSQNQLYGFGNSFIDKNFDQFSNLTINNHEYFIFSSSQDSSLFKTWDNTIQSWITNGNYQLNISQATNVGSQQQIIGGQSFNIMDWYSNDQAYINSSSSFNSFNFQVDSTSSNSSEINNSYYVNNTLSIIGGKFQTSNIQNIAFIYNSTNNGSVTDLDNITWGQNTTIETLYVDSTGEYLFIGTNGPVEVNNNNITGVVIYDLMNNTFTSFQPAELSNQDGSIIEVNSIVLYDSGSKLLVGGKFSQAGSLDCSGLCVYDLVNTRWINPQNDNSNGTVSGTVTDIKFYSSNNVLISGNLTVNNNPVNFITYDFTNEIFNIKSSLNLLGSGKVVQKFILNDFNNVNLNGRLVAYGDDFIYGFDGSNWYEIDEEIEYDNSTSFNDIKLLTLAKDSNYNQTLFDKDMIVALAGTFSLTNYGLVNLALYNGTNWVPYIFTSNSSNQIGSIKSLLIEDSYRFQSSDDISGPKHLSTGKVVGISMACALGSTTLMGLLYIIPYFALFRKRDNEGTERIHENEMIDAVNPEDLLHEIDIQRN
ncbi:cortical protein marker for cell polarity-domain-containing protein, partial [Scheffersomyces amazonensis]|uniref:cortical protein marker for cell polarity-domain-containing protein n=1 Tax=Scheffersomyces amazonensis TaxID=1078765 RepID=UPI00315DC68D